MTIEEKIQEEKLWINKYKTEIEDTVRNCYYNSDHRLSNLSLKVSQRQLEEHKEILEWLEELKKLREYFNSTEIGKYRFQKGYNKAIDEAICKVEEHKTKSYVTGITSNPFEFGACQMADDIVKILEQLKVGEEE